MRSLPEGYRAAVVGATGAIGGAVATALEADPRAGAVLRFGRSGAAPIDYADEASLARAAEAAAEEGEIRLLFIATGGLRIAADGRVVAEPEKALSRLTPEALAAQFALNAAGPALALKHFAAKALARKGRCLAAALSARVGSIGDNRLGGWYGYRAAKAALNQIWRSAAIELARSRPETVLALLHPGTVESGLSRPFRPEGAARPEIFTPQESAAKLLATLDARGPEQSGGFWDYNGEPIPW